MDFAASFAVVAPELILTGAGLALLLSTKSDEPGEIIHKPTAISPAAAAMQQNFAFTPKFPKMHPNFSNVDVMMMHAHLQQQQQQQQRFPVSPMLCDPEKYRQFLVQMNRARFALPVGR